VPVRCCKVWSLGIFISLIGLGLALHRTLGLIDTRLFFYYFAFVAGILTSRIDRQGKSTIPIRLLNSAMFVLLPFSAYLMLRSGAGYESSLEPKHLAATNIYMISFVGVLGSISRFIKRFRPVRWSASILSTGSYFVYLFHRPLWRLITLAAGTNDPLYLFGLQFFIGSPAIIFISHQFQEYYYHRILPQLERS